MAKDPAFLFYPGDWNLGTMHMTILEKGAYIELLMLQFARGKFTEAQAKHMLNGSFNVAWPTLKEKFESDGEYYWNKRLLAETEKRRKFSESRRNNGSIEKNNKKLDKHMLKHMENENINEYINDKEGVQGEINRWNFKPGEKEMDITLPEIKAGAAIELYYYTNHKKLTPQQIETLWCIFKKQNFTGEKPYPTIQDAYSHFINWLKTQKVNGTNNESASKNGKSTSAYKLASRVAGVDPGQQG